jgi:hypothetical protein
MSEEPKSIWKKSWKGRRGLLLWMVSLSVVVFLLEMIVFYLLPGRKEVREMVGIAIIDALSVGVLTVLIIAFVRSLLCWRNFKRFLFGLACFITLVALFYAEEDWRGKHEWENFKHEWEAKGERFDRAGAVPPPVPDDQNFALTPIVFTSYGQMLTRDGKEIPYKDRNTNFVNRLVMLIALNDEWPTNGTGDWRKATTGHLDVWQRYYREVAAKTNLFPVPAQPQSPAADVLLALSKYAPTIEELREAAKLPCSRFPLEYDKEDPWAILLPHLATLKKCSQLLQLRTLAELQNGQSDRALADIKLTLRLVDSISTEPFLISHLVRMVMVNIALQPVWEGLASHQWSEAQLAELDQELAGLDFLHAYNLSMRSELVLGQVAGIDNLRSHPAQMTEFFNDLSGYGSSSSSPGLVRVVAWLIPSGWFYQNQLRCARPMVEFYLPAADANQRIISPAATSRAEAMVAADMNSHSPFNYFERLLLPALGKATRKFANGQCSVDLARVAIALERYRLVHGEFPDTLDALTPQFIAKLPHDVIGGQPLHYRCTPDGQFILYSIGWNETDDDGKVVLNEHGVVDIGAGDWVWRYPQK